MFMICENKVAESVSIVLFQYIWELRTCIIVFAIIIVINVIVIIRGASWQEKPCIFGHFAAQIFCQKWDNSLNSSFDFGKEYFDND